MLDAFFRGVRFRRAAREYARRLPAQLRKDYGAGEFYTPQQIRMSAARAKLPEAYVAFGFAAFMSEDEFAKINIVEPIYDFHDLRRVLRRYAPERPVSAGLEPAAGPAIQGESSGWGS